MWINLKKYINQDFEIQKDLIAFFAVKKEIFKEHDKDIGTPIWILAIGISGLPAPILIKCPTETEVLNVKEEIKNA